MIIQEWKELLQKMFTSKTKFAKEYGLSRNTIKNAEFGWSPIPDKVAEAITDYIDTLQALNIKFNSLEKRKWV